MNKTIICGLLLLLSISVVSALSIDRIRATGTTTMYIIQLECNGYYKSTYNPYGTWNIYYPTTQCENGDTINWILPSDPTYIIKSCIVVNGVCKL